MLTFNNETIINNIFRISSGRGYDKVTISEFMAFTENYYDHDITVYDIIKASIKLKVRPSAFLYATMPLAEIRDEVETISIKDVKQARALQTEKEKLEFLKALPFSERKILLSLIMTIRTEENLYCHMFQPLENIIEDAYKTMVRIWSEYSREYKKRRKGFVYDSLDMHPIIEICDNGQSLIRGLDAYISDFMNIANNLEYDPIEIIDGKTVTLSDEEYFENLYSTLHDRIRESIWTFAVMRVTEKYKSDTDFTKINHATHPYMYMK